DIKFTIRTEPLIKRRMISSEINDHSDKCVAEPALNQQLDLPLSEWPGRKCAQRARALQDEASGVRGRGALPPFPTPARPTISHPILRITQFTSPVAHSALMPFATYFERSRSQYRAPSALSDMEPAASVEEIALALPFESRADPDGCRAL